LYRKRWPEAGSDLRGLLTNIRKYLEIDESREA